MTTQLDFYPLPAGRVPYYKAVFNETYWSNPDQPADGNVCIDDAIGRPDRLKTSFSGKQMLESFIGRDYSRMARSIILQTGSLFDASQYDTQSLVHSTVEGLHQQAKPNEDQEPEYFYAHVRSGFFIQRRDAEGQATYYQGDAWHIILPGARIAADKFVAPIAINAVANDTLELTNDKVDRVYDPMDVLGADTFTKWDYAGWVIGQAVDFTQPLSKGFLAKKAPKNQTAHYRFTASEIYKRQNHRRGNSDNQRDKIWKPAQDLVPRFSFSV